MNRDERERARRLAAGGVVDLEQVKAPVRAYAAGRPEIEAVWAFGSQAAGRPRATSDLDLALQVSPRPPLGEEVFYCAERQRELEALLGVPVDVVLLSPALPVPLLWEILGRPCLLFEREQEVGTGYASYLRGLCRDQWPRLERRWERTRRWLEEVRANAPPRQE